ncbi:hypothetical protein G5B18_01675 [Blautia glucerasea]|nr:hypothetical protein [Blautia glucerasea]
MSKMLAAVIVTVRPSLCWIALVKVAGAERCAKHRPIATVMYAPQST